MSLVGKIVYHGFHVVKNQTIGNMLIAGALYLMDGVEGLKTYREMALFFQPLIALSSGTYHAFRQIDNATSWSPLDYQRHYDEIRRRRGLLK